MFLPVPHPHKFADPDPQKNADPDPGQKRIRITGYSFRKALETEKINMLESFLHQGKKATYVYLC